MRRNNPLRWLVPLLLAGPSAALLNAAGCSYSVDVTCPTRLHPGHLDEFGNPDECCYSIIPCCPNPVWGRKATSNGLEVNDPCCMEVPCPGWDPYAGADAGMGTGPTVADAGADADTDADADADAGS
jgi:hypothetical protein